MDKNKIEELATEYMPLYNQDIDSIAFLHGRSGFIAGMNKAINYIGCSKELKDKYKTDFDQWKITNGYVKDLKHKCYFKGDTAYFDFDLIEEYNKEVMSLELLRTDANIIECDKN